MRTTLSALLGVLLVATCLCLADDPPAPQAKPVANQPAASDEEKAIRATVDAFAQAIRKGDAPAIAALFTEDGEAVDGEGNAIQGREALETHYSGRFVAGPDDKIENTLESIKLLAPGVARGSGRTVVPPTDGGPPATSRYSALFVKRDGKWLLASVREQSEQELSSSDHLKELEWLIGDWVQESPDAVVRTSVEWADEKHFLLRKFDVQVQGKPALTGTQRIGWDPLTKQIKSWVFDSRGGYGEGLWMRGGNQWVIKATGVRPDGRVATATQVLTYINNDSLRWKSIDRTIGSDINADIDEIVMARKPPQPK
jgi:uncharacterized protein (TIGR02246 family)